MKQQEQQQGQQQEQQQEQYKYFAFISYNHKDVKWGKRLQHKLENYRMSAVLCRERGWERKPINPVWFAPTDIQPGVLPEELKKELNASKNLIVICSPNSAKSSWVGEEIEYFHSLGRVKNIYFFIVDGVPHSKDSKLECFNPIVDKLGMPEILGANIHEKIYRWPWLNKERAYVQLITKLLGVEFDSIWRRHRRLLIRNMLLWLLGAIAVLMSLFYVWRTNQPVDVAVQLHETTEHNAELPRMENAVVTMSIGNETKLDTIKTTDDSGLFRHVPQRFIGKEVRMTVDCKNFIKVDTSVVLSKNVTLDIRRDASVFGDVCFTLWDEDTQATVSKKTVYIDGIETKSDSRGVVSLKIPLSQQKPKYHISAEIPLEVDTIYVPCGAADIICVK